MNVGYLESTDQIVLFELGRDYTLYSTDGLGWHFMKYDQVIIDLGPFELEDVSAAV